MHKSLSDAELLEKLKKKEIAPYELEKVLGDDFRAVSLRRAWFKTQSRYKNDFDKLPLENLDYSVVKNACCENVLGHVPIPVCCVGPLTIDDKIFYVPIATMMGTLALDLRKACRVLTAARGVVTEVYANTMTRGPVVQFSGIKEAANFKRWIDNYDNFQSMKRTFDSTSSRFLKLKFVEARLAGSLVCLRFGATTGDAMGMNMVSKGTEAVLKDLLNWHPSMRIVSLSGNYCVDKKSSAVNWIEGRGKSVVSESIIPSKVIENVYNVRPELLVKMNQCKNLIGSAVSGAVGGANGCCSDVVAAIFLATGQDVAQTVASSNCLTSLECTVDGDLQISCTMPSLEVGTVGGGTVLTAQKTCLEFLNCAGGNDDDPGFNAIQLARVICAVVLAGELSHLAKLCSSAAVETTNLRVSHEQKRASSSVLPFSVDVVRENRKSFVQKFAVPIDRLPYENFDYSLLSKRFSFADDLILGYVTVPVGYAGPLLVDGASYYVPLATTEGALVASTNRGCKAITHAGGAKTRVCSEITQLLSILEFCDSNEAADFKHWTSENENFNFLKKTFENCSRNGELKYIVASVAGHLVYLRFGAVVKDSSREIVSESVRTVLDELRRWHSSTILSVTFDDNLSNSKKPSALNWIEGCGVSIVSEIVIPANTIESIFKTSVERLVHLNNCKNLVGSLMAGALGGFNAHSSNIVTATFLALGQDVARNCSSSNCLTMLTATENGDLKMSCTLPSLNLCGVGSDNCLPANKACLEFFKSPTADDGCCWATQTAKIVASTVMAGELSLLAALSTNDLVRSHLRHNRSMLNLKSAGGETSSSKNKDLPLSTAEQLAMLANKSMKNAGLLQPQSCSKVLT